MELPCCKGKSIIVGIALVGLFLGSAFLNVATAQTNGATQEQIAAALQDLSGAYGASVESTEQAKDICSQERFLATCAEIGKKHNLFDADQLKEVDVLLEELKGDVVAQLVRCQDEECLLEVADSLAAKYCSLSFD